MGRVSPQMRRLCMLLPREKLLGRITGRRLRRYNRGLSLFALLIFLFEVATLVPSIGSDSLP